MNDIQRTKMVYIIPAILSAITSIVLFMWWGWGWLFFNVITIGLIGILSEEIQHLRDAIKWKPLHTKLLESLKNNKKDITNVSYKESGLKFKYNNYNYTLNGNYIGVDGTDYCIDKQIRREMYKLIYDIKYENEEKERIIELNKLENAVNELTENKKVIYDLPVYVK